MNDDAFEVLNAVYLRKIATVEVVGDCTGRDRADALQTLTTHVESGLVDDLGGQYMLTETGTKAVLDAYAERYSGLRGDGAVEAWYQRFETLNSQFLKTISAWQTGGEESQLDKLLKVVERQMKVLGTISETVPRYSRYAERFERAQLRVEAGKTDFVTSPTLDSIHNVWFEFHEDILTVLGRPRLDAEA